MDGVYGNGQDQPGNGWDIVSVIFSEPKWKIGKDEPNLTVTILRNRLSSVFFEKGFLGGAVHLTRWVSAEAHFLLLWLGVFLLRAKRGGTNFRDR